MNQVSKRTFVFVAIAFVIFAGSAVRFFVCLAYNPLDFLWLLDPLRHWGNGLRFPKGAYYGASDPIVYQAYIFLLRKLTADNRFLVGLVSAMMSVVMPWTYYRAARSFGLQKMPALWAWALIVWTPSLIAIYHYIMMETLLLLLDGLALWATARYVRRGGGKAFLISVLLWTLSCLTKPSVIPLAAVCILAGSWKRMPPVKSVVTAAVLVLLLLVPQAIRSEIALGFIAPFGNPWLTKIQHRCGVHTLQVNFFSHQNRFIHFKSYPLYDMTFETPSEFIQPLMPLSDWRIRRASTNSKLVVSIDSQYGSRDWKKAYDALAVSRDEWLSQWRENIILFLFAPSYPETTSSDWADELESWARWMWAPLIVCVLIGNFWEFSKRRFDIIPLAATAFTLFLALQNVVTFEGRYRKPLEPLLLLNLVWILGNNLSRFSQGEQESIQPS